MLAKPSSYRSSKSNIEDEIFDCDHSAATYLIRIQGVDSQHVHHVFLGLARSLPFSGLLGAQILGSVHVTGLPSPWHHPHVAVACFLVCEPLGRLLLSVLLALREEAALGLGVLESDIVRSESGGWGIEAEEARGGRGGRDVLQCCRSRMSDRR